MFGKNIFSIFKQAKQFKEQMEEIKSELETMEVNADAGGGMVNVTANGTGTVIDISIDASLLDADEKEVLETLIVSAVNSAKRKAEKEASNYVKSMTGDLPFANMFDSGSEVIGEDL
jgi:hypothetical protein